MIFFYPTVSNSDNRADRLSAASVANMTTGVLIVFLLLALVFFISAVLMSVVYSSLIVEVDAQDVQLSFGIGMVQRIIPRPKIAQAVQVRNSCWYGWMWNRSGLDAVELTYTDGKISHR